MSIPTAKEFAEEFLYTTKGTRPTMYQYAIEFTKLHVRAALEEASHVLDTNADADYIEHPTAERIKDSYPLTNIK